MAHALKTPQKRFQLAVFLSVGMSNADCSQSTLLIKSADTSKMRGLVPSSSKTRGVFSACCSSKSPRAHHLQSQQRPRPAYAAVAPA